MTNYLCVSQRVLFQPPSQLLCNSSFHPAIQFQFQLVSNFLAHFRVDLNSNCRIDSTVASIQASSYTWSYNIQFKIKCFAYSIQALSPSIRCEKNKKMIKQWQLPLLPCLWAPMTATLIAGKFGNWLPSCK